MNHVLNFLRDEDGAALTEYVVLLGLLVAGVITAVLIFGTELNAVWESWGSWMNNVPHPGIT